MIDNISSHLYFFDDLQYTVSTKNECYWRIL